MDDILSAAESDQSARTSSHRSARSDRVEIVTRIHDLRHSFASALANAGVGLFEIGQVLGHSQLSTTTRYAHHAPERLVATATTALSVWDLNPAE